MARSGAALAAYGPKFRYSHFAGTKTLRYAAGGAAAVGALTVAAQVPPLRNFLSGKVPQGSGPDEAKRERSWFTVDFVGEGGGPHGPHSRLRRRPRLHRDGEDAGGGGAVPGLRRQPDDRRPGHHGRGDGRALLARLQAAGLRFETVS